MKSSLLFFFCNTYKSELYNNQNRFDWDMSLKKQNLYIFKSIPPPPGDLNNNTRGGGCKDLRIIPLYYTPSSNGEEGEFLSYGRSYIS